MKWEQRRCVQALAAEWLLLAGGFLQEVLIRLTERVQQTLSDRLVHIFHFS